MSVSLPPPIARPAHYAPGNECPDPGNTRSRQKWQWTLLLFFFTMSLGMGRAQAQRVVSKEGSDLPYTQQLLLEKAAKSSRKPASPLKTGAKTAAACTNTTTLSFATQPVGDDWKNHAPVNAGGGSTNTTIKTAGSYTEPSGTVQTGLAVDGTTLGVRTLLWNTDYTSNAAVTTTITYSFNRPVNNFTVQIQDIDQGTGSWTDVLQYVAKQADGTTLSFATDATITQNDATTTSVTNSTNTIKGLKGNTDGQPNGTVKVTFNKPIISFQIIYQNLEPVTNPGVQYVGIDFMTWCTQANVAT